MKVKLSKRKKKKLFKIGLGFAGVLLIVCISRVVIHGKNFDNSKSEATVQSAQAEKGTISTTVVGIGTLESSQTTDVKVPVGVEIKEVLVDSGDEVKKGQKLATITEASIAKLLLEVKEEIEDTEDDIEDLSSDAKKAEQSSDVGNADSSSTSSILGNGSASSGIYENDAVKVSVKTQESQIMFLSTAENGNTKVTIKDCSIDVEAPVTGEKPQTELSESDYFNGTISWNCSTDTFQENTVYTATIKLTAKEGYVFSKNILPEVKGADVTSEVLESEAGESILKIKAQFAKTGKATEDSSDEQQTTTDNSSQNTENSENKNASNEAAGNVTESSGSTQAPKVSGGSVSAQAKASDGGVSGISSENKTAVSIQVDEMDINSVKEGQSATITLDALEGESFEGTITSVSSVASASGNSVKYPVEIELDKTENMLLGMSASATIFVEESEDAVLIPVNALQERGNKTFVYTEKDSEGNLSGEKEVETGLSNESQVEIVSGLAEGDTVYYLKVGNDQSDLSGMKQWGGERSGNGEMPSGGMPNGEMPSGNMPSGNKPNREDR